MSDRNHPGEGAVILYENAGYNGGWLELRGPAGRTSLEGKKFEDAKKPKNEEVSARSRALKTGGGTWVLAHPTVAGDAVDRLYLGSGVEIWDLKSCGLDNAIRSIEIWTSHDRSDLPSFRYGAPCDCFVVLARERGSISRGLMLEGPVEIPSLEPYRLYGPTAQSPSVVVRTGPATWVQLCLLEDFHEPPPPSDRKTPHDTSVWLEPNTVIRDLAAFFPNSQQPWIKSLKIWREEPSHWPGATVPPGPATDLYKVVRFALFNHQLRGATISAVKVLVGFLGAPGILSGGVGFLYGKLWPDPLAHPMRVWAELFGSMQALLEELVAKLERTLLDKGVQAVQLKVESYLRDEYGDTAKPIHLVDVSGSLLTLEPWFAAPDHPETTLPYFVPLASLSLTALREDYSAYEALYGKPPTAGDLASRKAKIREMLKRYLKVACTGRADALAWRLSKISIAKAQTGKAVVDTYADWNSPVYSEDILKTVLAQRQQRITNQYGAELDDYLDNAYLWPAFVPLADPNSEWKFVKTRQSRYSGPFGGPLKPSRKAFTDEDRGERITRIRMWGHGGVDALEVFYGGRSAGVRGKVEPGGQVVDVGFADDEHIVGAYGWDGDSMDQLVFRTNKGRELGVGLQGVEMRPGGHPWLAWAPHEDARLGGFSGIEGPHLEALTLRWDYERTEARSPADPFGEGGLDLCSDKLDEQIDAL